jgi:hypothetical protein
LHGGNPEHYGSEVMDRGWRLLNTNNNNGTSGCRWSKRLDDALKMITDSGIVLAAC